MKEKIIKPDRISPVVHYSNYVPVKPQANWGPRVISDFELILIVSGKFSYLDCVSGTKTILEEGKILCICPGREHIFKCKEISSQHSVMSCIHLDLHEGSFLSSDYSLENLPPLVTDVYGDTAVHELFRNCRNTFEGFGKYRSELLSAIAKELWLRLCEYWEGGSDQAISPRMQQMTLFLRQNINKSPNRNDLAKKFSITPEHINALFKKELGISPTTFIRRAKIYQSCRLLREEGLSIKEIADRLGFYDEFHFSKAFKKVMAASPSTFKGKTRIK